MTTDELNQYFYNLLEIRNFAEADPSQNGLQVDNSGKEVRKAAFAVDACMETIKRAAELGADMLFVHHGLFWGKSTLITGIHYKRIKALIDNDIALYAVHLPLDAHPRYGNNVGLAERIGLHELKPFGKWKGVQIGLCGSFEKELSLDEAVLKLFPNGEKVLNILPFGKRKIKTAGIISGGGAGGIQEAALQGLDLYITGEIEHAVYHTALENRINVIAGGHYQTETVGVQLVAEKLERDTGLEVCFVDVPTGM